MTDIVCEKCERRSCRPPEYAPLCAKHYLESVKQAERSAAARFEARMAELRASREHSDRGEFVPRSESSTNQGVDIAPNLCQDRRSK